MVVCVFGIISLGIVFNKKRCWCNSVRWKSNAGFTFLFLTLSVRV